MVKFLLYVEKKFVVNKTICNFAPDDRKNQ